jgi:hypothetical protein
MVEELLDRSSVNAAIHGLPVPEQDAFIARLREAGPTGDEAVRVAALDQAVATNKRRTDLLKEDPRTLGVELGVVDARAPAISDWSQPTVVSELARRSKEMAKVASMERSGPLTVLSPGEAAGLTSAWNGADTNGKAALLGTLVQGLPPASLSATLAPLADQPASRMLAIAGALRAANLDAAFSVVRGSEALKADGKFAFDEGDEKYLAARDEAFPVGALAPGAAAAWAGNLAAVRAAYADLSQRAGDSTGKFNEDRWRSALDLVTGGILEHNGGKLVAPRPGVGQRELDDVIAAMPEGAMAGAVTANGAPVPMSFVRDYGVLRSAGDGRYMIELGRGTGSFAVRAPRSISEVGIGGPFILDLRPWLDQMPVKVDRGQLRPLGRFGLVPF